MAKKTANLLPVTALLLPDFGERSKLGHLSRKLTAKQLPERTGLRPLTLRSLDGGTEPYKVSITRYFRLNLAEADKIIQDFIDIVSQWRTIANGLQLPQREQEYMADAFRLAVN